METVKRFSLGRHGLEELKDTELLIGQIIWLNGYGQSPRSHERKAIYGVDTTCFGKVYLTINLDNPRKEKHEAYTVRHESRLFGIGMYYTDGDMADNEEMVDALNEANKREEAAKVKDSYLKEMRLKRVAEGKKLFEDNMPEGARAVMVAELKKDESDIMTDYFASSTTKRIVLAFSMHEKDLFNEMRKAAENCLLPGVNALKDAPKEYEHREKWSMGAGYYLGKSKYDGWVIRKTSLKWGLEDLYEDAAMEDGFFARK